MALIDKDQIRAKAPAKIYIPVIKDIYGDHLEIEARWQREANDAFDFNVEYIRKDLVDTLPEQPVPTIMTNEMLMGEIKPKKKSNALFDECVKNCDPAVMKEVSDNVDKMLGRKPVEGLDVTDFCKPIDPGIAKCVADYWWELLDDENAADKKAVKEIVKTVHKEVTRQVKEIVDKQPVEGLEEAAHNFALHYDNGTCDGIAQDCFIAGAEWQKEQFEKNRLAACDAQTEEEYVREIGLVDKFVIGENRMPTFSDAINYGIEWQKAKMMEDAVEGKVFMSFAPGHNQVVMADVDLPTNTKVKVIIVKEDEL